MSAMAMSAPAATDAAIPGTSRSPSLASPPTPPLSPASSRRHRHHRRGAGGGVTAYTPPVVRFEAVPVRLPQRGLRFPAVEVTFAISPSHFYFRWTARKALFAEICDRCEAEFKASKALCPPYSSSPFPRPGSLALARCPETDEAMRARVVDTAQHETFGPLASVQFLDVGHVRWLPLHSLRRPSAALLDLAEPMAHKASIAGVGPTENDDGGDAEGQTTYVDGWSERATDLFLDLVDRCKDERQDCLLDLHQRLPDRFSVDLLCRSDDRNGAVSVRDSLKLSGLAAMDLNAGGDGEIVYVYAWDPLAMKM